jgi:hypothetical protein
MLLPATGWARTWEIQEDGLGDAPTVQAGIDSAAVGDTVLVHPGTYNEVIDFLGKDIVVKSAMGPEVTILDGSGFTGVAVVTFQSGETRAARLEGLTVTRGERGVLVQEAEPTIVLNVITENSGARSGAGIWCFVWNIDLGVWSPLIQDNIVTRNQAGNISGGIGTWHRMLPEILDNYIAENEAIDGDGGGIYYRGWDDGGVIRGNIIENNFAGDHGGGVYSGSGLFGTTFSFELSWNLIANNTANGREGTGDSGGGVWLSETNAWVHHNTVVGNEGNGSGSPNGGGMVLRRPGSPVVEQNIIALSQAGGGIWCSTDVTPIIRNNLAWQNVPADGVGSCPTWWQSNGNIVADPYFCNSGDYTLAEDSPAITHPAGPLGAFPTPGCGPVPTIPTTLGAIKSKYGN